MLLLHILRGVFVLIVAAIAFLYAEQVPDFAEHRVAVILLAVMGAFLIIVVDMVWPRKSLRALAGVLFGLLAGMTVTYVFGLILEFLGTVFMPVPETPQIMSLIEQAREALTREETTKVMSLLARAENVPQHSNLLLQFIKFMVGALTCYITISFVMQTKDDFRFVIPYVEFSRQTKGARPFLLDTSVIIDGRISDICQTGIIESEVTIPRFILQELQNIADSADRLKRKRGRRGLDILNTMQTDKRIDLVIRDMDFAADLGGTVDEMLVAAAERINARIVTNDYNLNKIARLRGVEVINVNDLANALKPVFLPGESLKLKIVKPGEGPGQGVGYLDDGTMVVVEQARNRIGQTVGITVTSALQTSAGRLVFGKVTDGGPGSNPRDSRRSNNRSNSRNYKPDRGQ
ncbi:MAG: TRAM domain-containing protein [Desulfobacteraceae bacterium]|nr:TRAM domain-containing protein [Desulfobacteraceae bacterium]